VKARAFVIPKTFRPALWPTQRPMHCVPGALSPRVKRLELRLTTHLYLVPRLRMSGGLWFHGVCRENVISYHIFSITEMKQFYLGK
jgi:hypothetical protein